MVLESGKKKLLRTADNRHISYQHANQFVIQLALTRMIVLVNARKYRNETIEVISVNREVDPGHQS